MWRCALTRQRPGQFLDFDGAQLSAPQVDVFIGVELQKEDGVKAESRCTPHWKKRTKCGIIVLPAATGTSEDRNSKESDDPHERVGYLNVGLIKR